MTPDNSAVPPRPRSRLTFNVALVSALIIPLNVGVFAVAVSNRDIIGPMMVICGLLIVAQFVTGLIAFIAGIRARWVGPAVTGGLTILGSCLASSGMMVVLAASSTGAGGRPLRIRGRQQHPGLCEGDEWTRGEPPDPSPLDEATRRALEALWLSDAQTEHASVPAFSRLSWILAAVGAPAELLAWSHRAALEEIEHARLCFALAAGYAGRSHTVAPMPQLLRGGLEVQGDPLVLLACESLADGCQHEGFNADVAVEAARLCTEGATKRVLERIAVEERSHAELSWAVVDWLLEKHWAYVAPALAEAVEALDRYRRPTAVSWDKQALVEAADAQVLRSHGRLPDARWGALWKLRLDATNLRVQALLSRRHAA